MKRTPAEVALSSTFAAVLGGEPLLMMVDCLTQMYAAPKSSFVAGLNLYCEQRRRIVHLAGELGLDALHVQAEAQGQGA